MQVIYVSVFEFILQYVPKNQNRNQGYVFPILANGQHSDTLFITDLTSGPRTKCSCELQLRLSFHFFITKCSLLRQKQGRGKKSMHSFSERVFFALRKNSTMDLLYTRLPCTEKHCVACVLFMSCISSQLSKIQRLFF